MAVDHPTADPNAPYFDTSGQRWYLRDWPHHGFTTEEDARTARRLGEEFARVALIDLADRIRDALP